MEENNPNEKTPSLMRESIDINGNVQYGTDNSEPDMADKTIQAVEGFMNTKDHIEEYSMEEVKQYKTLAIFSYVPIVSIILLIIGKQKKSEYLKFHINQGIVITIITATVSIISAILGTIFKVETMLQNNVPEWVGFISFFLYSICLIAMIYGIANTFNDKSKEIPIIGKIKLIK